jgi:hypothetical protein
MPIGPAREEMSEEMSEEAVVAVIRGGEEARFLVEVEGITSTGTSFSTNLLAWVSALAAARTEEEGPSSRSARPPLSSAAGVMTTAMVTTLDMATAGSMRLVETSRTRAISLSLHTPLQAQAQVQVQALTGTRMTQGTV